MTPLRRTVVVLAAGALAAPLLLTGGSAPAVAPRPHDHGHGHPTSPESAQVVLDWERAAFAAIYPANLVPVGVPLLGYTSTAMYDAATMSMRWHDSSETAAVATAAHDVLVRYAPGAKTALDTQLKTTLAGVADGDAEDRGVRAGEKVAARLIDERADDGYGDTTIHYTLPPGTGTWQPTDPATGMVGAWIGSMDPLVVRRLAKADGPDKLTSDDYATDYTEVKLLGSATSTVRTQAQTDTARFFSANAATTVGDALVRYLESHPVSLEDTAWTFAAMHGAMTDALIRCWQLKRDVGFWRPVEAVPAAAADKNPDTRPEAGWTPLLAPTPAYSDYVSGHGCVTSPQVEVIRTRFGETTPLELRTSAALALPPRTYATLEQLELDALNSRIWGGLHFRDAMSDAYGIGRRTARSVMHAMD
jgi:hypothetical protein